jgi:putative OmpL-like beta-barrel porin-2
MLSVHPRLFGSSVLLTLLVSTLARAQDVLPPTEPAEPPAPAVTFNLFADTYVSYNSTQSGDPVPYHRAYDNNTPFDPLANFPVDAAGAPSFGSRNGFGLSFVGLDANWDTGVVGATALLRFGPSVPIYYANDTGIAGIDSFLAGFVTVRPVPQLTIDAGYFGTIYGAEVAESWINFNYTRGALYYAMQPFYHFGAKANYAISDAVSVRVMVVNGANNVADENDAPALGLQLALNDIGGVLDLALGGFYETGSDSAWGIETFVDAVAVLTLGDLTLLANFDYNINRGNDALPATDPFSEDVSNWGVMGTVAYGITPEIGVAVRGEYLSDPDNVVWTPAPGADAFTDSMDLVTLTATLDLKLVDHLSFRPEFRYEIAGGDIYTDSDGGPTDGWYTAVLGLVAHSN